MISELFFFFLQLSERCDKLPMSPSKWDSVEVLTPFVEAINRHDAKALARWVTVDQVFVYSLADWIPWWGQSRSSPQRQRSHSSVITGQALSQKPIMSLRPSSVPPSTQRAARASPR